MSGDGPSIEPRGLDVVKRATLAAALVEAQRAAHAVSKESRNSFQGYRYASAEAVITEARAALNAAGLSLSVSSATIRAGVAASRLSGDTPPVAVVVYRLEHESGEHRLVETETPIIEEKGRPLDKAMATARTYSLSYLLRDLLLLPRVEEGTDVDQRDDRALGSGARKSTKEGRAPEAEAAPAVQVASRAVDQWSPLRLDIERCVSEVDMSSVDARNELRDWLTKLPKAVKKHGVEVWAARVKAWGEQIDPTAAE